MDADKRRHHVVELPYSFDFRRDVMWSLPPAMMRAIFDLRALPGTRALTEEPAVPTMDAPLGVRLVVRPADALEATPEADAVADPDCANCLHVAGVSELDKSRKGYKQFVELRMYHGHWNRMIDVSGFGFDLGTHRPDPPASGMLSAQQPQYPVY